MTFFWLVTIGSMLSAFWILSANSFVQHQLDHVMNNGRAEMTGLRSLFQLTQSLV